MSKWHRRLSPRTLVLSASYHSKSRICSQQGQDSPLLKTSCIGNYRQCLCKNNRQSIVNSVHISSSAYTCIVLKRKWSFPRNHLDIERQTPFRIKSSAILSLPKTYDKRILCLGFKGFVVQCITNNKLTAIIGKLCKLLYSVVRFQNALHHFSTDSYVMTIWWNRLVKTIPTNGHNIGFGWE